MNKRFQRAFLIVLTLVCTLCGLFALSACVEEELPNVIFSNDKVQMQEGDTKRITVQVTGTEQTDLVWSSKNESIVTVSGDGTSATLTAISQGATFVYAKLASDESVYDSIRVVVAEAPVDPEDCEHIDEDEDGLCDRCDTELSTESDDPVLPDTPVTPDTPDTPVAPDTPDEPDVPTLTPELIVPQVNYSVELGETVTIVASKRNSDDPITFTSKKPSVATIDQNGVVSSVAKGVTAIIVSLNGVDSITVRVAVVLEPCETHDFGDWQSDGIVHWRVCLVCNDEERDVHTPIALTCGQRATCSVCSKSYGEPLQHLMGAWTPVEPADCENDGSQERVCMRTGCSYREADVLEATGHDFEGALWEHDGTNHYYVCQNTGCNETSNFGAHIGGTATCVSAKKCTICQLSYGELSSVHNYIEGRWVKDDAHFAKRCADCDETEYFVNSYGRSSTGEFGGKSAIVLSNTASGVEVKFTGTQLKASIAATMLGTETNSDGSTPKHSLRIYVDGELFSKTVALETSSPYAEYTLVNGLRAGTHTAKIYKVLEECDGNIYINAFSGDHITFHVPEARPQYKIEAYGDELISGTGVSASSANSVVYLNQADGTKSFAFLAAQRLGYELEVVSRRGIGVHYLVGSVGATMPQCFDSYGVSNTTAWQFQDPGEIVLLNVGMTDLQFAMGESDQKSALARVQESYTAWIKNIRTTHPNSHIVCTYGATDHAINYLVDGMVAALKSEGDAKVYSLPLIRNQLGGNGCPDAITHERNADVLADFINDVMNGDLVEAPQAVSYNADFSNGLPSDWTLYDKSDITGSTGEYGATKTSEGVAISARTQDAGINKYYGSVYEIGNYTSVRDFTLEMRFKVEKNSYPNDRRWIGIMYHTKKTASGNIQSFLMNYRVSGESAQSTVAYKNNTISFHDTFATTGNPVLSDDGWHTMTITVKDGTACHYMDNRLVMGYVLRPQAESYMDRDPNTAGGFALVVNQMKVEIAYLTISGSTGTDWKNTVSDSPTLYNPTTKLASAPTVAQKVSSEYYLSKLMTTSQVAQNAILYVDESLNVVGKDGASLGYHVREFIGATNRLPYSLPVIYVKDMRTAYKFVSCYTREGGRIDMAVMSNNLQVLSYLRGEIPDIRGIMDWSEYTIDSKEDYDYVIQQSNVAMAGVVVLSFEDGTAEAIRYIQARLKTVWIDVEDYSKIASSVAIANGTYGLVTENYETAFASISSFTGAGTLVNRQFYDIAHRGAVKTYPELSFEGYKHSYEQGANHFEIDVWMTSDGELVLCHDETINGIANTPSGSQGILVSSLTYTQFKSYKLRKSYNSSTITSYSTCDLKQIFDYAWNKDDLVIAFEMKDTSYNAFAKLHQMLEDYRKAGKDLYDQIFLITQKGELYMSVTKGMIPTMPTAYLTYKNGNTLLKNLSYFNQLNTGIDCNYNCYTNGSYPLNMLDLTHRGISAWNWTYDTSASVIDGIKAGVLGITNNEPDKVNVLVESMEYNGGTSFTARRFNNKTATVTATQMDSGTVNGKGYQVYYYTFNDTVTAANGTTSTFQYTMYGTNL